LDQVNEEDEDRKVRSSLIPFRDWVVLAQDNTIPFVDEEDGLPTPQLLPHRPSLVKVPFLFSLETPAAITVPLLPFLTIPHPIHLLLPLQTPQSPCPT
jgi:hypothetical protein